MAQLWAKISASKHFDKLLLCLLFIVTVGLCVYLMRKNDAGGDDMSFIVWSETQAAMILGGLIGLIKGDTHDQPNPATTTTTSTTVTTPDPTEPNP